MDNERRNEIVTCLVILSIIVFAFLWFVIYSGCVNTNQRLTRENINLTEEVGELNDYIDELEIKLKNCNSTEIDFVCEPADCDDTGILSTNNILIVNSFFNAGLSLIPIFILSLTLKFKIRKNDENFSGIIKLFLISIILSLFLGFILHVLGINFISSFGITIF